MGVDGRGARCRSRARHPCRAVAAGSVQNVLNIGRLCASCISRSGREAAAVQGIQKVCARLAGVGACCAGCIVGGCIVGTARQILSQVIEIVRPVDDAGCRECLRRRGAVIVFQRGVRKDPVRLRRGQRPAAVVQDVHHLRDRVARLRVGRHPAVFVHGALARAVSRKRQLKVPVIFAKERSQELCPCHHVLLRIHRVRRAHRLRRPRHQLHEAHGAAPVQGSRVEARLLLRDCTQNIRGHPIGGRGLFENSIQCGIACGRGQGRSRGAPVRTLAPRIGRAPVAAVRPAPVRAAVQTGKIIRAACAVLRVGNRVPEIIRAYRAPPRDEAGRLLLTLLRVLVLSNGINKSHR